MVMQVEAFTQSLRPFPLSPVLHQRQKSKLSKNETKPMKYQSIFRQVWFFFPLLPTTSELFNLNLLAASAAHQLDSLRSMSKCFVPINGAPIKYVWPSDPWRVPEGNQRRHVRTAPLCAANTARAQCDPLNILLLADVEMHRAPPRANARHTHRFNNMGH